MPLWLRLGLPILTALGISIFAYVQYAGTFLFRFTAELEVDGRALILDRVIRCRPQNPDTGQFWGADVGAISTPISDTEEVILSLPRICPWLAVEQEKGQWPRQIQAPGGFIPLLSIAQRDDRRFQIATVVNPDVQPQAPRALFKSARLSGGEGLFADPYDAFHWFDLWPGRANVTGGPTLVALHYYAAPLSVWPRFGAPFAAEWQARQRRGNAIYGLKPQMEDAERGVLRVTAGLLPSLFDIGLGCRIEETQEFCDQVPPAFARVPIYGMSCQTTEETADVTLGVLYFCKRNSLIIPIRRSFREDITFSLDGERFEGIPKVMFFQDQFLARDYFDMQVSTTTQ